MYKIIAIEGIDRIGKSSFIEKLENELSKKDEYTNIRIEKPSVGINNLYKYPLHGIPGIMEIRNIGLFEEVVFQANHHITSNQKNITIIRDRFNLSELAYGKVLRFKQFNKFGDNDEIGFEVYKKWNNWFEEQLQLTGAEIYLITFVLNDSSLPNKDEVDYLNKNDNLRKINQEFIQLHEYSKFENKLLIELNMNNNLTDIFDKLDEVINFIEK